MTMPRARSGTNSTISIVPSTGEPVRGVAAPDYLSDSDRSVGQRLELHLRIPARMVANVMHRDELKDLGRWPVDDLRKLDLDVPVLMRRVRVPSSSY
jgi:hypothetical protein